MGPEVEPLAVLCTSVYVFLSVLIFEVWDTTARDANPR